MNMLLPPSSHIQCCFSRFKEPFKVTVLICSASEHEPAAVAATLQYRWGDWLPKISFERVNAQENQHSQNPSQHTKDIQFPTVSRGSPSRTEDVRIIVEASGCKKVCVSLSTRREWRIESGKSSFSTSIFCFQGVNRLLKVRLVAYESGVPQRVYAFTRLSNVGLILVLQFFECSLQSFTFNFVVVGIIGSLRKCLGKTFMFSF